MESALRESKSSHPLAPAEATPPCGHETWTTFLKPLGVKKPNLPATTSTIATEPGPSLGNQFHWSIQTPR